MTHQSKSIGEVRSCVFSPGSSGPLLQGGKSRARHATFSVAFSRRLVGTNIKHRSITASRTIHQRERKMAPSSSPSSSQQSSLYQYYTPIASNDSSSQSTSRALQPSTHQNIPPRRSRIAIKRPLHPSTSISPSPKKQKAETIQRIVPAVS